MGRFSDWITKKDGTDKGEDFSYTQRQDVADNNFDRYYADRTFAEQPKSLPAPESGRRRLFSAPAKKSPIPPVADPRTGGAVVIYTPKTYEDVQTLIDYLKRDEPAIVNLAGIADSSAQRILDFMSGAVYGLSGSIKRIVGSVFLLTPRGVKIMVPDNDKD